MIKAVIIDDEDNCLEVLQYEIKRNHPEIEIIACFNDSAKALSQIEALDADVVFLDIEMPKYNAFQFLDALGKIDFQIIFTTAYDHYALRAFRYYAVDYLLKPIDNKSLSDAIKRVSENKRPWQKQILTEIYSKINSPNTIFSKIVLPTSSGYEFVDISDILRCEASSNYATVYLVSGSKIVISRPLKYLGELLEGHGFFRIHQSNLVNLSYLKKYDKNDGGYVTMTDGSRVNVANAKKSSFEAFLKGS